MALSYSFADVEQLWINNGGNPIWAPLAAGIAMAESGGNSTALNNNPNTGDYSVGLWQINYYGSLLGPRTALYGSPSTLQGDPNAQARAAVQLSGNGSNWQPWQTDKAWNAWQAAGAPTGPNAQTVQGWLSSAGVGTGGSSAATIPAVTTSTAGGGQGGAPYTPSSVPGVPATPPPLPDFTLNPYNELSRVLTWTGEFGAWAIFIFVVFLFGALLMVLGLVILVVLFAAPVAAPVAAAVTGRTPVGRVVKGASNLGARRQQAQASNQRAQNTATRLELQERRVANQEGARARRTYERGTSTPGPGRPLTEAERARRRERRRREGFSVDRQPATA